MALGHMWTRRFHVETKRWLTGRNGQRANPIAVGRNLHANAAAQSPGPACRHDRFEGWRDRCGLSRSLSGKSFFGLFYLISVKKNESFAKSVKSFLWFNVVNFCFDLALNHGDYRLFHYCIEKSADLITIATLLSFVITWCLRSHVRKPRIPEQLLKPFKGAGCLANPNKVDLNWKITDTFLSFLIYEMTL